MAIARDCLFSVVWVSGPLGDCTIALAIARQGERIGVASTKEQLIHLKTRLYSKVQQPLSECYFAGKGAALVLPPNERARPSRRVSSAGCDIQQHLQSMFYLLRPEETLKMSNPKSLKMSHFSARERKSVFISFCGFKCH
ncbi:hypothetical protein KQX54_019630 [Cotesia glomerata]|uniref:Uncharacterized protein n=1 Tax=Cotesia glomerata TaxID=32391 RepID=A0AAV7IY78_COTGL|nr:hypothetical protein KQX54_019630 [Cotesia glomerata]